MRTLCLLLAVTLLALAWKPAQSAPVSTPPSGADIAQDVTQGALRVSGASDTLVECPLKHTDVRADISGFIARVTVTQTFTNPYNDKIEAVYVFPLPHTAAVDNMTMVVGNRHIVGIIKKRADARAIYEQALANGQLASLLEQERPNIFTQSVGNIAPRQTVKITISYVDVLKYDLGSYEFHFPMVVGPRYNPGAPFAGTAPKVSTPAPSSPPPPAAPTATTTPAGVMPPDGLNPAVLPPGMRNGHDISLSVKLDAGVPIQGVNVVQHKANVVKLNAAKLVATLDPSDAIPNKDFILKYDVVGETPAMAVLANKTDSAGGYLMLMLQPKIDDQLAKSPPREIIFLIDISGSMSGAPTEENKAILRNFYQRMKPDDTLQVVTFASAPYQLFPQAVPATKENLDKAQTYTDALQANNSTEMLTGIKQAMSAPTDPKRMRIVVMMTDGYIGNEPEVLEAVGKYTNDQVRFWALGVGSSVNRMLIDGVGKKGEGMSEVVPLNSDPAAIVEKVSSRIHRAQLANISINWNGLPISNIYPRKIPELWAGKPVILFARYAEGGGADIAINGVAEGTPISYPLHVTLPDTEPANDVLAKVWARNKIEDLEMQVNYAESPAVAEEVTQIALDYKLMSQYTSFVAVDEQAAKALNATPTPPRRVDIPVPLPAGVSFAGIYGTFGEQAGEQLRLEGFADVAANDWAPDGRVSNIPADQMAFRKRQPARELQTGSTAKKPVLLMGLASIAGNVAPQASPTLTVSPYCTTSPYATSPAGASAPYGTPPPYTSTSPYGVAASPAPAPISGRVINKGGISHARAGTTGVPGPAGQAGAPGSTVTAAKALPPTPTSDTDVKLKLAGGKDSDDEVVTATESPALEMAAYARHLQETGNLRQQEAQKALEAAKKLQNNKQYAAALRRCQQAYVLETAALTLNPGQDDGTLNNTLLAMQTTGTAIDQANEQSYPALKAKLNLVLCNQSVADALHAIGKAAGVTITLLPGSIADAADLLGATPRVTYLDLRHATVTQALNWLLTPAHLTWTLEKHSLVIGSARRLPGDAVWVYDVSGMVVSPKELADAKNAQHSIATAPAVFLTGIRAVLGQRSESCLTPGTAALIGVGRLLVYGDATAQAKVAALLSALITPKARLPKLDAKGNKQLLALQQATTRRWVDSRASREQMKAARAQGDVLTALNAYSWRLLAAGVRGQLDLEALSELQTAWSAGSLPQATEHNGLLAARSAWCIAEASRRLPKESALAALAARTQPVLDSQLKANTATLAKNANDTQAYYATLYAALALRGNAQNAAQLETATALLVKSASGTPLAATRTVAAALFAPGAESDTTLTAAIRAHQQIVGDDLLVLTEYAAQTRGGAPAQAFREELPELVKVQQLNGDVVILLNRMDGAKVAMAK